MLIDRILRLGSFSTDIYSIGRILGRLSMGRFNVYYYLETHASLPA
jgi:hypothetical protein